jgi:hypothetical protein
MAVKNQIAFVLTEAEVAEANTAIDTLKRVLKPKLVQLTTDSRRELPKMGDKTVGFVEKTLEYGRKHPEFVPSYVKIDDANVDLAAVKVLRDFSTPINNIAEMISDTMMLSGSEAYGTSLSVYNNIKGASEDGQPGARLLYEDLKARFPRNLVTVAPEVEEQTTPV